jgi:acyl-CoA synthetase (AMP-forming)/AMP-acid ligase II
LVTASRLRITQALVQVSRVVAIPVFHAAAAPWTHFGALRTGIVLYIMRRFDLEIFLVTTEKYNVTEILVVPPIALAILMSPFSKERPFLKKVRCGIIGAAPLDKDVQARFRALLGDDSPFTQVWGMTETTCIATMFYHPEHDDTGSVGRLIPNVEAKFVPQALTFSCVSS